MLANKRMNVPVMQAVPITAYTLTCAAGKGINAVRDSIRTSTSGLSAGPWPGSDIDTFLGRVVGLEEEDIVLNTPDESRNNRLAACGLEHDGFIDAVAEVTARFGADRCALILGTSTSSIGRTESAFADLDEQGRFRRTYQQPSIHNPHSTTDFVARRLGIGGPRMTISTACSSSAKTFASATRWIDCGIADAVVVGGVDSVCLSVIHGFHSLQLVSAQACRPFDKARDGINLGEAAGFALITRSPAESFDISLLGYGESCDAYHMSSAHPEGLGAELAMRSAIARSGLEFSDIGYVNLHGTGTRSNDDIEARICETLFPAGTPASSTKGLTGHTLGAAGITEAIIAFDALQTGLLPATLNTADLEPVFQSSILTENREQRVATVMTNSFGFGGNNCSLIFGSSLT